MLRDDLLIVLSTVDNDIYAEGVALYSLGIHTFQGGAKKMQMKSYTLEDTRRIVMKCAKQDKLIC